MSYRKQKGKSLEDYVAHHLKKIDPYAYRRADSGSGKLRKEDVFTRLPLFIECKNQKKKSIGSWYSKAEMDTPKDKYTILVYKEDYQRGATVYMRARVLIGLIASVTVDRSFDHFVSMEFFDFINLLEEIYGLSAEL